MFRGPIAGPLPMILSTGRRASRTATKIYPATLQVYYTRNFSVSRSCNELKPYIELSERPKRQTRTNDLTKKKISLPLNEGTGPKHDDGYNQQATLLAKDSETLDVKGFDVELLSRFLQKSLDRQGLTITMLCTAAQRHLLDPVNGIIPCLLSKRSLHTDPVTVITGIVDRVGVLPSEYPYISRITESGAMLDPPIWGAEGVTISLNLEPLAINGVATERKDTLFPAKSASGGDDESLCCKHGYISFTFGRTTNDAERRDPTTTKTIALQLARTVMYTGTDFLLRHQIWNSATELTTDEPLNSIELEPTEHSCGNMTVTAPSGLITYTQPRRIVSSSGNVIQTFQEPSHASKSQTQTISASSELEARVAQSSRRGGEIWAAVQSSPGRWPAFWNSDESADLLFASLINEGIRLYRVGAGGGGWEGSGGPVTLDVPQQTAPSATFAESEDSDLYFARLQRYLSGADSIVKPGDIVQFLCVQPEYIEPYENAERPGPSLSRPPKNHFLSLPDYMLGTLPLPENRQQPLKHLGNPFLLGSFCALSDSAEYTLQAIPSQADHGEAPLGRLFSTALPPLITFMRTRTKLARIPSGEDISGYILSNDLRWSKQGSRREER